MILAGHYWWLGDRAFVAAFAAAALAALAGDALAGGSMVVASSCALLAAGIGWAGLFRRRLFYDPRSRRLEWERGLPPFLKRREIETARYDYVLLHQPEVRDDRRPTAPHCVALYRSGAQPLALIEGLGREAADQAASALSLVLGKPLVRFDELSRHSIPVTISGTVPVATRASSIAAVQRALDEAAARRPFPIAASSGLVLGYLLTAAASLAFSGSGIPALALLWFEVALLGIVMAWRWFCDRSPREHLAELGEAAPALFAGVAVLILLVVKAYEPLRDLLTDEAPRAWLARILGAIFVPSLSLGAIAIGASYVLGQLHAGRRPEEALQRETRERERLRYFFPLSVLVTIGASVAGSGSLGAWLFIVLTGRLLAELRIEVRDHWPHLDERDLLAVAAGTATNVRAADGAGFK